MTRRDSRHGQDGDEIANLPVRRDEVGRGEKDHADDADGGEEHAELELLENFWHLDEEVGEFGFLGRRAPRHVDLEHVGQERLGDVERQATQEDTQHEGPFEVHEHWRSALVHGFESRWHFRTYSWRRILPCRHDISSQPGRCYRDR